MTDKKTFREKDNDKQRGKKRYQERIAEEREAEEEIKEYDRYESIPRDSEEHPST